MAFLLRDYDRGEKIIQDSNSLRIARSPHRITIPTGYNSALAYLAGYHLGDGYLSNYHNLQDKGRYELVYADEYKSQIEETLAPIFSKQFGVSLRIDKKKSNMWTGRINCKIIHMFLYQVLKMPMGRKGAFLIPEWILQDKHLLKSFISGFFDAEGSIFISNGRKANIALTNTNYLVLNHIRTLLAEQFGIFFGKIYKKHKIEVFEMRTNAKEIIIKFCKDIGFKHPHKQEKVKECLALLEKIHARPGKSEAARQNPQL